MNPIKTETSFYCTLQCLQSLGNRINQITIYLEKSLTKSIKQTLSSTLFTDALYWNYSDKENPSNWFYEDTYLSLPITYIRQPDKVFYLNIQISLYGAGMQSHSTTNKAPLLHVFFGDIPLHKENTFEVNLIHDSRENITSFNQKLFTWPPTTTSSYQPWLFSFYLAEFNTHQDIYEKLILPCLTLLNHPIKQNHLPINPHDMKALFVYPEK